MHFPPKFLQKNASPYFFHDAFGVDAPELVYSNWLL